MTESNQSAGKSNGAAIVFVGIFGVAIGALGTFLFYNSRGAGAGDPVVAKYGNTTITESQVFQAQSLKTRLYDLEEQLYQFKKDTVENYIEKELLEAESKKQKIPVQALVDKAVGKVPDVSDSEIDAFLKSRGISLDNPNIRKDDIKQYLQFQARFKKRKEYVDTLKAQTNAKVLLTEPIAPKVTVATAGFPSWGKADAPVTIVEFSDFQCPYCARVVPTIKQIKEAYGEDKVRIVFRDMPLPRHQRAEPAGLAALCANDQGKFWEFHDTLFENQGSLADADFEKYAKKHGLDLAKFKECFANKTHIGKIEQNKREARAAGIGATPSFVINGTLVQGALPFEQFKEKIDRALAGK